MLENNINTNSSTSTTTDCCFVECTTTTTIPCINPIDQLFEIATVFSEVNPIFSKLEALERLLDYGIILNSCGMCCSDCTYVFASGTTYQDIYNLPPVGANESSNNSDTICCVSAYGLVQLPLPSDFFKLNCCNNFTECVESIFNYFVENNCEVESDLGIFSLLQLYITILDIGVVEQGAINGQTQVCRIFEHMKNYFDTSCFIEEYFAILEKGIVIECRDGKMYIFSVESYNNYFNISA